MRFSQLFGQTLREAPSGSYSINHQLLIRATYMQQLGVGSFAFLHLGWLMLDKIKSIIKQEIENLNGQQISLPGLMNIDQENKSFIHSYGDRVTPTKGKERNLRRYGWDEQKLLELVRRSVYSNKQLPYLLFYFQKTRQDNLPPHGGLLRLRDFETLKCLSITGSRKDMAQQHTAIIEGFNNIYRQCHLPVIVTCSSNDKEEVPDDIEFYYLTPSGDETILICDKCGYKANQAKACLRKDLPIFEEAAELRKVSTPQIQNIQSLADFLNIPKSKTAKAVFYIARIIHDEEEKEEFVFVVVRGDMEVNEHKLLISLGASNLRKATDEEVKLNGAFPGFASPLGIDRGMVIVDELIPISSNLVAGANEENYHYLNVNYKRDYTAELVADIVLARDGDPCPNCGAEMKTEVGVCTGRLNLIESSEGLYKDFTFLDKDGKKKPLIMGIFYMEIERLLGCIAEEHSDDDGLCLQPDIAPYLIHLVSLKGGEDTAEKVYANLMSKKIEVFFDDREKSPGVKFNDADLMGIPLRITVSSRSLERGGVEWKRRNQKECCIVALDELNQKIKRTLANYQ
jgi:prolyl-tRNA synthetase